MTQRRPFDTGLRGLAARYSQDFLAWLQGSQARFEQNLDPVLIAQERRADFLVRFRDEAGTSRLLHAEFQRQVAQTGPSSERLPFRMAEYALAVYRRYGQIPEQVLVLLQPTAAAENLTDTLEEGGVRVRFRILRLWQLDPRLLLDSPQVGLWPLVPLMGGAPAEELLSICMEAIDQQVESTQQRTELLSVAVLLASIRVEPAFLTAFLESRAMFDLLQDTPLGQQLIREAELRVIREAELRGQQQIREAELRGRQQGVEQGVEQGEQRGRIEGIHRALVRQLTHRFGDLPDELLTRLRDIDDLDRLEQLLDAVLDAPDLERFRAQL